MYVYYFRAIFELRNIKYLFFVSYWVTLLNFPIY